MNKKIHKKMQISQTKICRNKKKVLPLQHFSIHIHLFYIFQIMINSQNFIKQNGNKYRAKVEFFRIYDTNEHTWRYYYSHEKQTTLMAFLASIRQLIGDTLYNCIGQMCYELYEFYYYADNIKIRKQGDHIIIFYDAKRK